MSIPNASRVPRVWTNEQIAEQANIAVNEFVDRRLAEPSGRYIHHIHTRRADILRLFKTLAGVDPKNPDIDVVRKVILDDALFAALRYVSGPPVSEDDLGVIVTRDARGFKKGDIRQSNQLAGAVLNLICRLTDPYRFPWVSAGRAPSRRELRQSIISTMTLHATQTLQTERRGYGKLVEKYFEKRLLELGFSKARAPSRGQVAAPKNYPRFPEFYGECTVHGRKVDLFVALPDGRMLAIEAKDSSSCLNSTKRILNDTAAKAKHFTSEGGKNIITVALLSGVFKIDDLSRAQEAGLFLVWAHDVEDFVDRIKSQT
jgi:hypothetical protein